MNKIDIYEFIPNPPPKGWTPGMGLIGWRGDELFFHAGAAGLSDAAAIIVAADKQLPICRYRGFILIAESWARLEAPQHGEVYDAIRKRALEVKTVNK